MNPADIILEQLGGAAFIFFTNSYNFTHSNNGRTLTMHLVKNKSEAKYLRITLTSSDDYKVEFLGERERKNYTEIFTIESYDEIYADQLHKIFTQVTGLYTAIVKKKGL